MSHDDRCKSANRFGDGFECICANKYVTPKSQFKPNKPSKPSWDDYFFNIANEVSKRATCDRLHVGCVIVRERQVLATGYNGSVRGEPHCDDEGHQMVEGHCVRTVHAEANAIAQAARSGVALDGATAYVTHKPCYGCHKLLRNAGVLYVKFDEDYGKEYPR